MKAILVIDQPKDCMECPLYSEDDYGYGCGYGTLENRRQTNTDDTIPTWCPLKPMPNDYPPYEKIRNQNFYTEEEFDAYEKGWNACLEEIEE